MKETQEGDKNDHETEDIISVTLFNLISFKPPPIIEAHPILEAPPY